LQGFLLEVEVSRIIVHEADEPNAVVDFLDAELLAGQLKPLDVERETRPGKYPDGDGLYLVVASATSKNWSYRYWKDGKQRWLGMGSVKEVSLKEARA